MRKIPINLIKSSTGHQGSSGSGEHVLQGGAEGTGIVQPGEEMAPGGPHSSFQHLQGGHCRQVEPDSSEANGRRMKDGGNKVNQGRF